MKKILILASCIALIGGICNAKASPPESVTFEKVELKQYQEVTLNYTVIECQEVSNIVVVDNELDVVKPVAINTVVCTSCTQDVCINVNTIKKKIPFRKIEPPLLEVNHLFDYSMASIQVSKIQSPLKNLFNIFDYSMAYSWLKC